MIQLLSMDMIKILCWDLWNFGLTCLYIFQIWHLEIQVHSRIPMTHLKWLLWLPQALVMYRYSEGTRYSKRSYLAVEYLKSYRSVTSTCSGHRVALEMNNKIPMTHLKWFPVAIPSLSNCTGTLKVPNTTKRDIMQKPMYCYSNLQ